MLLRGFALQRRLREKLRRRCALDGPSPEASAKAQKAFESHLIAGHLCRGSHCSDVGMTGVSP
ncbi:hypothetical protein PLANPX_1150 [Lacipirellula parvula]|uniref:Uncharacterized protein n=1 Tax=Lacipirellula parvula TaxID=2650471 RepID=A0A5K7X4Q9_9BACT|nr:hypothetical protein PLANPX_1150 [Lacipirellula parvula]